MTEPRNAHASPVEPGTIARNAVATLLYFDIFNHPLTVEETFAFLPENSITPDDLRRAIIDEARIDKHADEMLLLHGRSADLLKVRREKQRYAQTLWRRARIVARLIACFPFVRGLFVSGSLSKNAADPKADIDWFIVTEPGRLWICKTVLTLFRRTLLFNRTKYFCTNYYIASNALEIPDRNVFIATEIATARPLLNAPLAAKFFSANNWIRDYLPNAKAPDTKMVVNAPIAAMLRRIGEFFFRGAIGNWLETRFYALHVRYEKRKHAGISDEDFTMMFRSLPHECKIHQLNFQRRVIEAYAARLAAYGVERKIRE